jgi:acetyltransferase-like isoleucine patch superfamily enzyme
MIHQTALIDDAHIDPSTNVWAYAHVMPGAQIGRHVNIGDHCYIEGGAKIGDGVTVKNGVCIWEGVTIEDGVFIGPQVAFTNDVYPRSPRLGFAKEKYQDKANWLVATTLCRGCSVGARSVVLPGVRIGAFAMIGAGTVVTRNVPEFALVTGSPGRVVGTVCACGERLSSSNLVCNHCGLSSSQRTELLEARPV